MRCLCGAHNGEALQAFCCVFNPSLPLNPQPGAVAQRCTHSREMDTLTSHAPSFLSHLISRTPSCPTPALSIFVSAQQCSPAPPLFAFQQQPTQILMNPMWPLIALSAASLSLLQRGTMLICLLTSAHVGQTSHDADMCCVWRQLFPTLLWVMNQRHQTVMSTLLPVETDPLIPLHGYTEIIRWFELMIDLPQTTHSHTLNSQAGNTWREKGVSYCHIKEAQGRLWVQKTPHAACTIVPNGPCVCLPPTLSLSYASSHPVQPL